MDQLTFDNYDQNELDNNMKAAFANDARLRVRFRMHPVLMEFKSAQEGRAIYEDREYITIMIPGDKNSMIDRVVTEIDKKRFPELYERFKKTLSDTDTGTGTPLSVMPWITPAQTAEFAYLGIRSVEDLSNLSDSNLGKIMGGYKIREKAQMYLDAAKANSVNSAMEQQITAQNSEIESLKDQMAKLAKLLEDRKGK